MEPKAAICLFAQRNYWQARMGEAVGQVEAVRPEAELQVCASTFVSILQLEKGKQWEKCCQMSGKNFMYNIPLCLKRLWSNSSQVSHGQETVQKLPARSVKMPYDGLSFGEILAIQASHRCCPMVVFLQSQALQLWEKMGKNEAMVLCGVWAALQNPQGDLKTSFYLTF